MGVREIRNQLTALHIPSPGDTRRIPTRKIRDVGEWNETTIYALLRSTTYAGIYKQGRGNNSRYRQDTSTIIADVPVPAIFDQATWDAVQARIDAGRSKYNPRNQKRQYLLSGYARCGCGAAMGGMTVEAPSGSLYQYYFCTANRSTAIQRCRMPKHPMQRVDAVVWGWLDTEVLNENHIRQAVANRGDTVEEDRARLEADKERYYRQMAELEEEEDRYTLLFGKKRLTLEKYEELTAPLDRAKAAVQKELTQLDTTLAGLSSASESVEQLCDLVRDIRAALDCGVTVETKRRILDLLDCRVTLIVVDGKKWIDVSCALTLDNERLSIAAGKVFKVSFDSSVSSNDTI